MGRSPYLVKVRGARGYEPAPTKSRPMRQRGGDWIDLDSSMDDPNLVAVQPYQVTVARCRPLQFRAYNRSKGKKEAMATSAAGMEEPPEVVVATEEGALSIKVYESPQNGRQCVKVQMMPWVSKYGRKEGTNKVLYDGELRKYAPIVDAETPALPGFED